LHRSFGASLAQNPARIAGCDDPRRDLPGDDAAGSYDAAIADFDSRTKDATPSQPHIVSDVNFAGCLHAAPAELRIDRMEGCVDMNSRADLRVVTNGDAIAIEEYAIEIDEPSAADHDVDSVIAGKR
jgi:hypothetical protein